MNYIALFGSPVVHSLSPTIHQLFAEAENIAVDYQVHETLPGQLAQAVLKFRRQGGIGANVTLPLKMEAFQLCHRHTQNAVKAQAVNTLYWHQEELWGDNTDGEGLINDLTLNQGLSLKAKKILLLGAGGAARGILFPLLEAGVEKITIVNRTLSTAQTIALQDPRLEAFSYENLAHSSVERFDLVINATSASLKNELPPLSPHWIAGTIAVDLAYKTQTNTVFLAWTQTQGAVSTHDGIGMLVEQAALSFQRWFNLKPQTQSIIELFRQNKANIR